MTYVGVDLAWGEKARTGLAEVEADGRLIAMASARSDAEVDEWLFAREAPARVVAVDAPLIVPNDSGMRTCERLIGADYGRYGAAAYPSNRGMRYFNPPRAELLAARHGWSVDPAAPEVAGTRCIEVYPHAVLVGLFTLGRALAYKKGSLGSRQASAVQLLDLLETVPTLQAGASPRWNEVRAHVAGAMRPVDLDAVEDEIDAVVCAYAARLFVSGSCSRSTSSAGPPHSPRAAGRGGHRGRQVGGTARVPRGPVVAHALHGRAEREPGLERRHRGVGAQSELDARSHQSAKNSPVLITSARSSSCSPPTSARISSLTPRSSSPDCCSPDRWDDGGPHRRRRACTMSGLQVHPVQPYASLLT